MRIIPEVHECPVRNSPETARAFLGPEQVGNRSTNLAYPVMRL
jgi:hypothetical protein